MLLGAGSLLLLALVAVVVGYLSAPSSYLTRTIFWGESDYKDLQRFPARTVDNAPPVFHFDKLPADNPYASQIEAIGGTVVTVASKGTCRRAERRRSWWSTTIN